MNYEVERALFVPVDFDKMIAAAQSSDAAAGKFEVCKITANQLIDTR